MKTVKILSTLLTVIFVTSLAAVPAFANRRYRAPIHGQTRWERVYEPVEESEKYVVSSEEEKTGLIAGVFSAADWLVSGTLDMAGATYNSTEKLTRDVLTSAGNTVDGTMRFADDTVKGATGTVMETQK